MKDSLVKLSCIFALKNGKHLPSTPHKVINQHQALFSIPRKYTLADRSQVGGMGGLPFQTRAKRACSTTAAACCLRLMQNQQMPGQAYALFLINFTLAPSQLKGYNYLSTIKILPFTAEMEVRL